MRRLKCVISICLLSLSSLLYAATNYVPTPLDKALFNAVGAGNISQANSLIVKGAHLNAKHPPCGLTPLLIAPDVSREMVRYLLEKGADVNAADREGITVLMRAVHSRDAENVKEVLNFLPKLEAKGTWNNTALTYAVVVQGNPEMVKALIGAGANLNAVRADGMTPLDIAKRRVMQALSLQDEEPALPHNSAASSQHAGFSMVHDASKASIVNDSKAVLTMLKQAGAQAGTGAGANTAAMQHRFSQE
jgi:ankyrin repeat protein